jgi:hypothetical protein
MNVKFIIPYSAHKAKEEFDGIENDDLVTLQKLKQNQRQDYLKVSKW